MRVLIDACVLFPTVMREVLLGAAEAGLFEARWTPRIEEEWARAALKLGPAAEVIARGEIATLRARFPKATIEPKSGSEQGLWLPDPGDIHVLAGAISCSADAILTMNAKDFPRDILADYGLQRIDPDGFMITLAAAHFEVVEQVANDVLNVARQLSGNHLQMRPLMRKARLPRLGKMLG